MNIQINEKEIQTILTGLMMLEEKIMSSGKSMENEERVLHGPALKALILRFLNLEEEAGWKANYTPDESNDPPLFNAMVEGMEHVRRFMLDADSPGWKMAMVTFNPEQPAVEYLVVGSADQEPLEEAIEKLILKMGNPPVAP